MSTDLASEHLTDDCLTSPDFTELRKAVLIALSNPGGDVLASKSALASMTTGDLQELWSQGRAVTALESLTSESVARAITERSQILLVSSLPLSEPMPQINELGTIAHSNDLTLVVDNSALTAALFRPAEVGAGIILERAQEPMSQRAGLCWGSRVHLLRVRDELQADRSLGTEIGRPAVPATRDAYAVVTRRISDLSRHADALADTLNDLDWVAAVNRPTHTDHPWTREVYNGFGAEFAVEARSGTDPAMVTGFARDHRYSATPLIHCDDHRGPTYWFAALESVAPGVGRPTPDEPDVIRTSHTSRSLPQPFGSPTLAATRARFENEPWEAQCNLRVDSVDGTECPITVRTGTLQLGSERATRPFDVAIPAGVAPGELVGIALGGCVLMSRRRLKSVAGELVVEANGVRLTLHTSARDQALSDNRPTDVPTLWADHLLRALEAPTELRFSVFGPAQPQVFVLSDEDLVPAATADRVHVQAGRTRTLGLSGQLASGGEVPVDLPRQLGGTDAAPTPAELFLSALCEDVRRYLASRNSSATVRVTGHLDLRAEHEGLTDVAVTLVIADNEPDDPPPPAGRDELVRWANLSTVARCLLAAVHADLDGRASDVEADGG